VLKKRISISSGKNECKKLGSKNFAPKVKKMDVDQKVLEENVTSVKEPAKRKQAVKYTEHDLVGPKGLSALRNLFEEYKLKTDGKAPVS
jgi:hypothetical protein